MKIFSEDSFGKPISIELSEKLRAFTDSQDWANASIESGVSTSTIRDVIYRKNSITENNSKAIVYLMETAIKNCKENISKSSKAKKELELMLE